MKLRKIISVFAVVTILVSFVIPVSALTLTPTVVVNTTNIEELADNSAYPAAVDGYTRYLVTYTIDGISSSYADTYGLVGFQCKYAVKDADKANVHEKTYKAKDKGKASGVYSTFENAGTTLFQEGYFAMSATDGLYYDGSATLIETVWYVANNTSVTIDYNMDSMEGMYVKFGNWDAIATNTESYMACDGNLSMNKTSITLGNATPVVDKEFDTADTTVNSTNAVEGKYNGKILKHIATVLDKSALTKKISIKNESTGETRVSGRTIAQTLGGIGVDGATVTGTIAIGVLTDTDAVFTFSLVD